MPIYRLSLESVLVDYDLTTAMVVRAKDEAEARRLAAEETRYERGSVGHERANEWWLNEKDSECTLIPPDGPTDIVLQHFNAGW